MNCEAIMLVAVCGTGAGADDERQLISEHGGYKKQIRGIHIVTAI